jgi:DnaK suppressor protein
MVPFLQGKIFDKMKKKFLEMIKENLLAEKTSLKTKHYHDDIDMDGDETDEIQAKILANVSKQLSTRDNVKLFQIEQALARIDQGEFGSCEECEEEIGEKRLQFNPCFTTCISCAEAREIDKQRNRG